MIYYLVAILKSPLEPLVYSAKTPLREGAVVEVMLRNRLRRGVIIKEVSKPAFSALEIENSTTQYFSTLQIKLASFVSSYYFSSQGEALALCTPFDTALEPLDMAPLAASQISLNHEQEEALAFIKTKQRALLFGVTGSGKSEVFMEAIRGWLERGKSALVLMPEISLTPQMRLRFEKEFGERIFLWHSKLAKGQKQKTLQALHSKKPIIVLGARSALFLPFDNLGMVVVDEEHDESYKAHSRPRYHARDLSYLVASHYGASLLFASATPSLESYTKLEVAYLRKSYLSTTKRYYYTQSLGITSTMLSMIASCQKKGEQSIYFLPTRGHFKYLYCKSCGKTHTCPYCSVGMTLYRDNRMLKCHYCAFVSPITEQCQNCSQGPLVSERMGTQEAIELLSKELPGIQIERFDKDAISTNTKLKEALKRFSSHQSDMLLGTQMLTKGHDYPNVTLAIVTGVDFLLGLADYKARQKALSQVIQVSGRAGRGKDAIVYIETQNQAFFSRYIEDYEGFLKEELEVVEMLGYPPFASLARILIAHKDEQKAAKECEDLKKRLSSFENIELIGGGKAAIERVANRYRYHLLLRSTNKHHLLRVLHAVNSGKIEIDMDPVDFS